MAGSWSDGVPSAIDTLLGGGRYSGRSCSEIETAEPLSGLPGVELCSDVVTVPSLTIAVGSSSGRSEPEVLRPHFLQGQKIFFRKIKVKH